MTPTFDLIFLAWLAAAMNYISTNFGIDSSNHFPFRVRTWRHTYTSNGSHVALSQHLLSTLSHFLNFKNYDSTTVKCGVPLSWRGTTVRSVCGPCRRFRKRRSRASHRQRSPRWDEWMTCSDWPCQHCTWSLRPRRSNIHWRFGAVVASFLVRTKLLNAEPG